MLISVLWVFSIVFCQLSVADLKFSKPREAPFIVSIRRTEYERNFGYGHHHCSGALIDTTTIVTAASCLYDTLGNAMLEPKSFTIVAGTRYLSDTPPEEHGVIRECDRIIQHPHYDPTDHSNDIAYMKVVLPFDTTSGDIRPIALTDTLLDRDTVCHTFGWGFLNGTSGNSTKSGSVSKLQYSGSIQITRKSVCSAKFEKFEIGLQDDKVCAQIRHTKDSCKDLDPGGLLVCFRKLVGVVSIYSDCSLFDYPTVFTHVASHTKFLETRKNVMIVYYSTATTIFTDKLHYFLILLLILVMGIG